MNPVPIARVVMPSRATQTEEGSASPVVTTREETAQPHHPPLTVRQ